MEELEKLGKFLEPGSVYFNGHPNDADVIALREALEHVRVHGSVKTALAVIKSAVSDASWFVNVLKDHQTQNDSQEFKDALSWCELIAAWLSIKAHGVSQMPDMPAAAGQHAEIAHMRGLLGEMGRLGACSRVDCAHVGEAPMSQAGLLDTMYNGWNDNLGFTSAGYVWNKCWELLRLGGGQIPKDLKKDLYTLYHALRDADADEFEWTEDNPEKRQAQKESHEAGRMKIFDLYTQMLQAVQAEVLRFVTTVGLTWTQTRAELRKLTQKETSTLGMRTQQSGRLADDTHAVALSAFLTAIHKYLKRHGKTKGLE